MVHLLNFRQVIYYKSLVYNRIEQIKNLKTQITPQKRLIFFE